MTYNPDDWEAGDLAWITVTHSLRGPGHPLRVLRMLVDWPIAGRAWHGSGGRIPWRDARITDAERAEAVDPEALARQNDSEVPPGYVRLSFNADGTTTSTENVVATGYPRQGLTWSAASGTGAPPTIARCTIRGCGLCGNPR